MKKCRFSSQLLSIKMIFMFVVFGLLVGYLSFLLAAGLQTFRFYDRFHNNLKLELNDRFDTMSPDFFHRVFSDQSADSIRLARFLESVIPPDFAERSRITLYMGEPVLKPVGDSADQAPIVWSELVGFGALIPESSQLEMPLDRLEEVRACEYSWPKNLLRSPGQYKNIYLNLTDPADTREYILRINIEKEGFRSILEREKDLLTVFSLAVLIFSLAVGGLFARRLAKPIRGLSQQAEELASGNMDVRFQCNRLDDIGSLAVSLDTMSRNLRHRFDSMQTMNRIDRAVLSSVSRRELLHNVAGFISEQFGNAAVAVMSHREEGLLLSAVIPHDESLDDRLILYSSVSGMEGYQDEEFMKIELGSEEGEMLRRLHIFPPELIKKQLMVIPIYHNEGRVASFLITRDEFGSQDTEALQMLADQAGVALKSMIDMERQEELSQGTLMALTRSVDAKSRWTAGHSSRVAHLAVSLARELKMTERQVQTVRISALLHDIGKLGIPEVILDKPGRLTDEEFALIKSHPEKGDGIISTIPGFEEVRLGVRHHHEKWEGGGYPDGLAGERIPLIARILTLADVYDAVSEDRPYRKGFTREELLQFLEDQRGRIFDPDLLNAFLPLVLEAEEES